MKKIKVENIYNFIIHKLELYFYFINIINIK